MFTEFHHIPFLGMSNPELFIVKKDKKQIEFEVSSIPTLEFPDGSQVTASNDQPNLHDHHHHHQEEEQHNREEEEKCESTASSENLKTPCLGESEVVDDDDDGFRTPTSSDHKIPVIKQCPPAPKKLRLQPSRKNSQIEFEVSSIPTLEFPDGSQVTASNDQPNLHDHHHHHQEEEQHNREEEEKCESTASSENLKTPCLGESEVVDDDDDGFRTPTSSDHKIPVITQCPPAPKKLRLQPSRKTKASPPQLRRRSLQLDLLRDAELMFSPPPLREDSGRKIKRARRDYNTE